jgi:hypothetical protein
MIPPKKASEKDSYIPPMLLEVFVHLANNLSAFNRCNRF